MSEPAIDEICLVALAEAFRGDGELLCHPMGPFPVAAGRLARASFEPDLMLTDTIAYAVVGTLPLGATVGHPGEADEGIVVEGYLPFRTVFDHAWSGCRHVVMGASQIDGHGNQNFAAIGDYRKPKAQLLGLRGAPGNVINHTTSYWIPNQARAFVESVDVVSGPGYDRVAALPEDSGRFHEIRRVVTELAAYDFETPDRTMRLRSVTTLRIVTELAAYDFETPDRTMRLRSVHPGVSLDTVLAATPFELAVPDDVPASRLPTADELHLIRDVIDPKGIRKHEFRS